MNHDHDCSMHTCWRVCKCDDDDPCLCFPELANPEPRYVVRHSPSVIVATGIMPRGGVA